MKLSVLKPILFSCLLLLKLSGCGKLIDWGKEHCCQGNKRPIEKSQVEAHARSTQVYEEVTTLGLFDAVWLSDDVRALYTDVLAAKVGKNEEEKEEFLRRQLAENEHDISFYVFSYVPDESTLNEKDSAWTVMLDIDGNIYEPRVVMSSELTPVYKLLLDKYNSRYKNIHLIKFNTKNPDNTYRFTPESRQLKLIFNTTDRSTSMSWDVKDFKLLPTKKEKYKGCT